MFNIIDRYTDCAKRALEYFRPVADLVGRLYVAHVFFLSGLSKVSDWQTTLYLFREEYHVPLLRPDVAAVMGAGGELTFSVLLALGVFTQLSALGLSVVNIVAFISYYHELIQTPAAWHDHLEWGIILALLMSTRSGGLSFDGAWRRVSRYKTASAIG